MLSFLVSVSYILLNLSLSQSHKDIFCLSSRSLIIIFYLLYKSTIHLEWIFAYWVKRSQDFFFTMWISICLSTICWNNCPFSKKDIFVINQMSICLVCLQTTFFSIVLLVWFFASTITALFNIAFLKVFFF